MRPTRERASHRDPAGRSRYTSTVTRPIGIFALSSPFDRVRFEAGLAILRELGFEPVVPTGVHRRRGYLAGSDAERLATIDDLLARDDLEVLMAARGGYGIHRLLDALDYQRLADRTVVGFSDLTALHLALWSRARRPSIHGPVVTQLPDLRDDDRAALAAQLADPGAPVRLRGVVPEEVGGGPRRSDEGILLGGCLALVAGLAGTAYVDWPERTVLLLEEVHEAPYRIDRMLMQLELSGLPRRVAAVALGAFTGCAARQPGEPDGRTAALERLGRWNVPILADLPIGHGGENRAVPLGCPARVDLDSGVLDVRPER